MEAPNFIRVKFNANIHGRRAGTIEKVKAQKVKGGLIPLNKLIRRRLADGDGSVEIVKSEPKSFKPKDKTGSK